MTCKEYLRRRRKNDNIFIENLSNSNIEMILNTYCYYTGDDLSDIDNIFEWIDSFI